MLPCFEQAKPYILPVFCGAAVVFRGKAALA